MAQSTTLIIYSVVQIAKHRAWQLNVGVVWYSAMQVCVLCMHTYNRCILLLVLKPNACEEINSELWLLDYNDANIGVVCYCTLLYHL